MYQKTENVVRFSGKTTTSFVTDRGVRQGGVLSLLFIIIIDGVPFKWDKNCKKAFAAVKREISSERVLAHFDPTLPLVLATDASPYAVGAVLSHVYPDGSERPI
ncbi:RNase H-like domain found in reverse transcriptase [Popillia japonica]|uniref:RNase H-like domain found in reverse transcriptase n=1 Tax=Popillia japonica TaxID=7064 RepID=A0AAW1IWV7_POPJA